MGGDGEPGPLDRLTDEELRAAARARGLPVGSGLERGQLLALLEGGGLDEAEPDPSAPAPAGDGPALSTVTIARLYAEQGHAAEAARVCRAVLARRPDERRARALLARLSEVRAAPPRGRSHAPSAEPAAEPPPRGASAPSAPVFAAAGDGVVLVAVAPRRLHAFWNASAAAVARAASHGGGAGELVLRLFSAWRGTDGVVRRTTDDAAPAEGERFLDGCAPGAVHRAALGWLSPSRGFVPVVHSAVAETAPGRAVAAGRSETVALAFSRELRRGEVAASRLLARLADALPMDLPWERGETSWPDPAESPDVPGPSEPSGPPPGVPSSWS